MAVTRRPQRQQTSVPGRKTNIPSPIHSRSSAKKQVNHPSRKQAGAFQKTKQQSEKGAKPQKGSLLPKLKNRSIQPHTDNKYTVVAKGSTISPRVARNSTKRQSVLSATFTKAKAPKAKVSQKVAGRSSSNVEASSPQKSVLNEKNKPSNVAPETSSQSPRNEVHDDMGKNKNKAQSPSLVVAKRGSLRYSQLKNPSTPDSFKGRRKVVVRAEKKISSEVKLRGVSKKVVKVARSSLRKHASVSVISKSNVKGYLSISNYADSPSISIEDSGSLENSSENKTRSSLKPKNIFSDVAKNKKVARHLSRGQNNISSSRSRNASIIGARTKEDSDTVKLDNIMPKRKVREAYVNNDDALVSTNPVKKSKKTDDVPKPNKLRHRIRSNIAEKDSKVEADAPKNKSKVKKPNATTSKGLKRSIGEKDDNLSGDSKFDKDEADESVPSRNVKKSKIKNPTAVSNEGRCQAKVKNAARHSKSAKEDSDELRLSSKVKKSGKKRKQDIVLSTQGVRRSIRERFPPCETWRGQRPLFRFKQGQGFVYAGISPGRKKDEGARLSILKFLQQREEKSKAKKRETSKSVAKTAVFDRSNKKEVDVTLHRPFDTAEWTSVDQGDKTPFRLTKTFVSEKITFGFLEIFPLERKGSQYSPEANIHFVVVKGRLKVKVHCTEFLFERCDSFIVPCAVTYSIENLQKSKALLSFSTFQTPFFPHQKEMND